MSANSLPRPSRPSIAPPTGPLPSLPVPKQRSSNVGPTTRASLLPGAANTRAVSSSSLPYRPTSKHLTSPDRCPVENRCARQSASVPFHNHPDMVGDRIQPVRCRRVRRLEETWSIGECRQYPRVKRLPGITALRSREALILEEREVYYRNHPYHPPVYSMEAQIPSQ